jgi:hypothetical protein
MTATEARGVRGAAGLWIALLIIPATARAHPSGGPAVAWPLDPRGVGVQADQEFAFTWTDTNLFTPTGTITIDWFFTTQMPPTFQIGSTPPDLRGTVIVRGIPEKDRTDRWVWNTSTVAAGSYFIWSRVNDLPTEVNSIRINAFSPGVVTIAHPGDPVYPAIFMPTPDTPFTFADSGYRVTWQAFDPDHSARIKIELMHNRDVAEARVLAQDLVATSTGSLWVDTSSEAEGDLIFRATIEDARGLRFVSYPRYLLRVQHEVVLPDGGPGTPDANGGADRAMPPDAAPADAGTTDAGEAKKTSGGCGCETTAPTDLGVVWIGLAALALSGRRYLARASSRARGRR